jgi:hypothetical protein
MAGFQVSINGRFWVSTEGMAIGDRAGLPVTISITSASPREVTLVEQTLDATLTREAPVRLIGDRAYDSDPLDARLVYERAVELIAPPRRPHQHHAGWSSASPISAALENRTPVRLASELSSHRHALGTQRRQLPRLRPTRMYRYSATLFVR